MRNALIKLMVVQFTVYTIFGVVGFAAWALAFTNTMPILELIVGEYIQGHLIRWTTQFPLWGILILISSALSLSATYFLWRAQKVGGYLGTASFSLGFITNMLFARNILVHSLIGALIGWILLAPLAIAWKNLDSNKITKNNRVG